MPHENRGEKTTFGYLSTIRTAEHGYFGGYLVVSSLGRPLEFHCTSPVQPSRAQEILYGATLEPYLVGEQIGGTLLKAAKLTPRLVLTDQEAMLAVCQHAGMLVVRLLADEPTLAPGGETPHGEAAAAGTGREPICHLARPSRGQLIAGGYVLQLPPGCESHHTAICEALADIAPHVDLAEPLGRIHEAIREAQRIGGRTNDAHGQAA